MTVKETQIEVGVDGLEATQATQIYRSRQSDGGVEVPENNVPLVAGKPLVVRVYPDVRHPTLMKVELTVDGELEYCPIPVISCSGSERSTAPAAEWLRADRFPGSVPAQRAESIDRSNATHTLNFRIPERHVTADLAVRSRVWVQPPRADRCSSPWVQTTLSFVQTRPLRLRLCGVHFRHGELDLDAPTAAEALQTLAYVRKTYPISGVELLSYETIDFSADFTERSGFECGRGWRELLLLLSRLRTARASAEPYYALLPNGVPSDGFGGFGLSLGVGASYAGEGPAMAQELAHIYHRRHAPGGGAQDVDSQYPACDGCPSGSIGECGVDPATGEVFSPRSSHDFMSYAGDYWVSPYTYQALLEALGGATPHDCTAPPEGNGDGRLYLHLGFSVRDDHDFELQSGLTLPGPPIDSFGDEMPWRLELRDAEDRVLSERTIRIRAGRPRDNRELHLLESIPYDPMARRLVFLCCDRHEPVTFEFPQDDELQVKLVDSPTDSVDDEAFLEGTIDLAWETTCGNPERLAFFLRYSADGGVSWQPVNMGFAWRSCRVDLGRLPGGDDCRLQVVASTVLQTATAETPSFRVRRKPRLAMIAGNSKTRRLSQGSVLELTGTAHSPDGFAGERELVWRSNLQGELGYGTFLTTCDLAPGEHQITLTAPDGLGGETQGRTVVQVLPAEVSMPREE